MRRILLVLAVSMLLLGAVPATGWARGVTTTQLEQAGWICFPAGAGPHCIPPGALASDASIPVLVFDGWGSGGNLLGTELLIRADLYAGQPCPQDEVEFLPASATGLGNDYYACHHFG